MIVYNVFMLLFAAVYIMAHPIFHKVSTFLENAWHFCEENFFQLQFNTLHLEKNIPSQVLNRIAERKNNGFHAQSNPNSRTPGQKWTRRRSSHRRLQLLLNKFRPVVLRTPTKQGYVPSHTLSRNSRAIETLRHDFVAMCQLTGSPATRNAPSCNLPISNDEEFRQLNEDLRNADFLATLVSKFTLLNHYIPTTARYILYIPYALQSYAYFHSTFTLHIAVIGRTHGLAFFPASTYYLRSGRGKIIWLLLTLFISFIKQYLFLSRMTGRIPTFTKRKATALTNIIVLTLFSLLFMFLFTAFSLYSI